MITLQEENLLFHTKNPTHWRQMSIDGAERVCNLLLKEEVDVVFSADDILTL